MAALVALIVGSVLPCSAAEQEELEAVRELVLAPLLQIGQSPESLAERLGNVRFSEVKAVIGADGQPSAAHLQVIEGDGWEAEICASSSVFNLSSFRVSRPHSSLRLSISIGETRGSLERILGPPSAELRDGSMVYRYPPSYPEYHLARVAVRNDRVTDIEWVFGLELEDPCKRARGELLSPPGLAGAEEVPPRE